MSLFADTHCHLYFQAFAEDFSQVLERAWQNHLAIIVIPGIDLETSRQAVELSKIHPNLYAAVGVHPNDATSWEPDTWKELFELAHDPKVVAIGEIGLDYYRDFSPAPMQRMVFTRQLELAAELVKPVIIHNRQASSDLWKELSAWHNNLLKVESPLAQRPGVLHSFDGNLEAVPEAISRHFFLGISGPVTFRNAADLQQVCADISLDHLLVETDAPFLAPVPHRGKRNEPAYVSLVAEKIAELQQVSSAAVAAATLHNAQRLFLWETSF